MTIWKYHLRRTDDVQEITMPDEAAVLTVAMQDDQITLWAWVDPDIEVAIRRFAIVGTGQPAPDFNDSIYHGTVFDGPFVWHIFEHDA